MKYIVIVIFLLFFALNADNLKQTANGYNLKQLLENAKNNYSLIAQNLLIKQAQKNFTITKLSLLPRLDINYNFTQSNRADLSFQTQAASLDLNFNLFKGFADFNSMREKNALFNKALNDEEFTKEQIYLQIVQNYYLYFSNQSNLFSLQQKLNQINSDVVRVKSLYEQGLGTIDDLESLKSQAALTQYQINDASLALEQSKLMLEYLTNTTITSLQRVDIKDPTFKLDTRADIKSLEFSLQLIIFLNKQINYYPSLDLRNTYTYNIEIPSYINPALLSQNPFLSASFAKNQNQFMIVLSYAIIDKADILVQKQALRLQELATSKILAYKKLEQERDEKLYRRSIVLAKSQIESARASLTSANISFDNVKKKYDSNLVTFTDYLRALSTKYDAEATFIRSLNNYELQKANYIFHSGQSLEGYILN